MAEEVDNKPLKDYVIPTDGGPHYSLVHPTIGPNNFEIKPSLVGMVQQNQFSELSMIGHNYTTISI